MPLSLKVPALGESVSEATLGTWKRAEGDYVQADEPLVEVESEKATLEVGAPGAGILKRILRKAGETVAVGEVIAEIDQTAKPEAARPSSQQKRVDGPAAPAAAGVNGSASGGTTTNGNGAAASASANAGDGDGNLRAPPSARRLLAESGLPASEVKGTGRGGRISKQDVVRALQDKSQPAPQEQDTSSEPQSVPASADAETPLTLRPDGARERVVPMSPLRRTVARRLVEAQHTAAILTTFNEVDMTNVISLRERFQERFQKQHNVKLGFMSFFVKGAIEALKTFPSVNAEIRGTDVIYKDHYDIGVAVGGGKGLVVPVVRDADRLSFAELEKTVAALAVRARDNKLTMKELEGGTFTISNGGVYGSMLSTPILNPPQSGILGLHAIQRRPMAVGNEVQIRSMMFIALSYDHRLVDGREAVQFLVRIKECVEDPDRILLEV
ncbi:MAG TPA: 2-oxoglutarate dehydrogenase complex dihydrolipoyllysine-residue succinyltransferase [Polyangia bacterium]|nr:2-oxoglutarate dehydrogenase complex dihydrolipoyllysine-residue succinyltransferase [Polyangia bacterium]